MNRLIFVCTANACRSQIAEGLARFYATGNVEVASAGIRPHPLDRMAVLVMLERGIDISRQVPKAIESMCLDGVTLIVTLCPRALMKLPPLPPHIHRLHWNIPDPNTVLGGAALSVYRDLRDRLEAKVKHLLSAIDTLPAVAATQLTPAVGVKVPLQHD